MMSLQEAFEGKRKNIESFEAEYRLPTLVGSEAQRTWARIIRDEFLGDLLAKVIEATRTLSGGEAREVYACLDQMRANGEAKWWIEVANPRRGEAVEFLLSLSAAEAAKRERERRADLERQEQQARAAESRQINKLAEAFNVTHALPPLLSHAESKKQVSFGNRCRYILLTRVSPTDLPSLLPAARAIISAGAWIGAFQRGMSVHELIAQIALARPSHPGK